MTVTTRTPNTTLRRAAVASLAGSAVEFYEFTIYGFLAVVFAPLFFPSSDPTASTLAALAVFGGGYLARPLGGIIFGALGDRVGRRSILLATIFLMGGASTLIGVLPTYAQAGLVAPLLLLVMRILQGVSAGGEFAGAQTYIVEMAPERRRGLYGSLPVFGAGLGFASAALVVALAYASLDADQMREWGWRAPFLLCLPLTLACLFLRLRLEDSPEFKAMVADAKVTRTPVRDVLRTQWADVIRMAFMTIAVLGPSFLVKVYMGIHLVTVKDLPPAQVYTVLGLVLLATALLFPVMGKLGDRRGRLPIIKVGYAAYLVLSVPLFLVVNASTNWWQLIPALVVFAVIEPVVAGSVYTSFAERFPGRVRYTGTALSFNLGAIAAAGFGPYICGQLIASTGWAASPGLWGSLCALLGLVAVLRSRETSQVELAR
ncbi:MFS transporter [Mycolicibacterium tokaiense]|uniref:Putative proline/betaine transporter n=1 Tax=Mycolicibacterium tokaiense TaxID=39695 RepID=A0A378TEE3_9MYCO|nr:MFS transporter [Mycolicibacterium tokaiense]BBY86611.1 MFS transporter [Mycolicibacterium tokaiense]STZ58884.1 arabinose efflux permease family protein [Mycolicibacterium tokaiense]